MIGMTNGPITMPDGRLAGAYVQAKDIHTCLTGGPDQGMMDINHADNYAKHEFTHMLGVGDRYEGNVVSNTPPNDRPDRATAQDFRWGVLEATQSVGLTLRLKNDYNGYYGSLPSPFRFSTTDNVGAPVYNPYIRPKPWWK